MAHTLHIMLLLVGGTQSARWCVSRYPPLNATEEAFLSNGKRLSWHSREVGRMGAEQRREEHDAFARRARRLPRSAPPEGAGPLLTSELCSRFVRDQSHLFRSMWGYKTIRMAPLCMPLDRQKTHEWAADIEAGAMCERNWFQGSVGCAGQTVLPGFSAPAPALMGVNSHIGQRCANAQRDAPRKHRYALHAEWRCILNNWNMLVLANKPAYEFCRNLEWLSCAARGLLPGQRGEGIYFDPPPSQLRVDRLFVDGQRAAHGQRAAADGTERATNGSSSSSSGRGGAERLPEHWVSDRAYDLEVCALNELCANRAELFQVDAYTPFKCQWEPGGVQRFIVLMAGDYYGPGQSLLVRRKKGHHQPSHHRQHHAPRSSGSGARPTVRLGRIGRLGGRPYGGTAPPFHLERPSGSGFAEEEAARWNRAAGREPPELDGA
jgi:hypothetical protein